MDAQIIEWTLGSMSEQDAGKRITELLIKGYQVTAYGTAQGSHSARAWILMVKH